MSEKKSKQKKGTVQELKTFYKDSMNLVKKCTKPDQKEYTKILQYCAMGFGIMGIVGFLIKLIFIPINNIILGSGTG